MREWILNRYAFNKLFYNNFEVDEKGAVSKIAFYYNQFKEIPKIIENLTQLQEVKIIYNQIPNIENLQGLSRLKT